MTPRWPLYAGIAATLVGAAMIAAASASRRQAAGTPGTPVDDPAPAVASPASNDTGAPPLATYPGDLRALFTLAAKRHVAVAAVDYRSDTDRAAAVIVRQVDLRITDEYPNVKAFVADALAALPHAQLSEVRFEQGSPNTVRLALVYSQDGAPFPLPATSARLDPRFVANPFAALGAGTPVALGQPKVPAKPAKAAQSVAAAPAPPPPPPSAPPLPFVAIGSIAGADVTDGKPVAFLQQQDQLLVVRAGQTVGTAYRIESITPQRIEITYLPLMQRQSLQLGP